MNEDESDGFSMISNESDDHFGSLNPAEIMSKLPINFKEKLVTIKESKNWQDRKEVLDRLLMILENTPRIQVNDYNELTSDLTNIIAKDANVNLVIVAAKCLTRMAFGLRKDFSNYATMCMWPLMERFKEKKPNVIDALHKACDAIYTTTNLDAIQEICVRLLAHKTPIVRQQVALFLARCFAMSNASSSISSKLLMLYLPPLLKNLNDADPTVRDSSAQVLGTIYKVFGDEVFNNAVKEPAKLEKIKEYSQMVVVLNKNGEPKFKTANSGGSTPEYDVVVEDNRVYDIDKIDELDEDYSIESVDILSELPRNFKTNLEEKDWKKRKESLDALLLLLQKNPRLQPTDYYELINDLNNIVAKDANVNIVIGAAKCLTGMATGLHQDFSKYAIICLASLMERFKEKKNDVVNALREACDAIYPSTNLQDIQEICVGYLAHKTPVVRQQVSLFLARCFRMASKTSLTQKTLSLYLPPLIKNLNDPDPSVRDSTSEALSALYRLFGDQILESVKEKTKIEKIKEYSQKSSQKEVIKELNKKYGDNVTTKKNKIEPTPGFKNTNISEMKNTGQMTKQPRPGQVNNLRPSENSNEIILNKLIDQMNDRDWKVRLVALQKLEELLQGNMLLDVNLDELPSQLNKRLADKVVAMNALKVSELLAKSLGLSGKKYLRTLMPAVINFLSDKKETTRKTAIGVINAWHENCGGLDSFTDENLLQSTLESAVNPNTKAELCGWLEEVLFMTKIGELPPEIKEIIIHIFKYAEDRNQFVRTAAQGVMVPLILHYGENEMEEVLKKFKPASQLVLKSAIEKAKNELLQITSDEYFDNNGVNEEDYDDLQHFKNMEVKQITANSPHKFQQNSTLQHISNKSNQIEEDMALRAQFNRLAEQEYQDKLNKSPTQTPNQNNKPNSLLRRPFYLNTSSDRKLRESVLTFQDLEELITKPIINNKPKQKILKDRQSFNDAIDFVITYINHHDIQISIENLLKIDELIKNDEEENKNHLIHHIDNLIMTCSAKLNIACNVYLDNSDYQTEAIFKLINCIFLVIIDIFESQLGYKTATTRSFCAIFYNLMLLMIDVRLPSYGSDGQKLILAANLVTLKIMEFADVTTCFCALVKMMTECCSKHSRRSPDQQSKCLDLVMKSIWRQIRKFPTNYDHNEVEKNSIYKRSNSKINDHLIEQIDTAKVLNEIHTFFVQYPSVSWQSQPSNLPLRTAKTLLFHFAKAKQEKIIDDLDSINIPNDSEITLYLTKLLQNQVELSLSPRKPNNLEQLTQEYKSKKAARDKMLNINDTERESISNNRNAVNTTDWTLLHSDLTRAGETNKVDKWLAHSGKFKSSTNLFENSPTQENNETMTTEKYSKGVNSGLKKKYQRTKTEPIHVNDEVTDENDLLNESIVNETSKLPNQSQIKHKEQQNNEFKAMFINDELYNEYKKRFELIKQTNKKAL